MTTRLKLLCHASTAANRISAFAADEPLDSRGRRKLAAFPHDLRGAGRRCTSPALRAAETAEILQLDAVVEPMLRDCDYGSWRGHSLDEVQARDPQSVAQWLRDPAAAPHGGESHAALMDRIAAWLDAQRGASQRIIAVTHASVVRAAVVHAIEAGPRSFWRIDVAPLSLTLLSENNGRWTLVSLGAAAVAGWR